MCIRDRYIVGADTHDVFEHMLTALLEMTSSEYGFIGEVLRDQDGMPYLLSLIHI